MTLKEMEDAAFACATHLGIRGENAWRLVGEAIVTRARLSKTLRSRSSHRRSHETRKEALVVGASRTEHLESSSGRRHFSFPLLYEFEQIFFRLSLTYEVEDEDGQPRAADVRLLRFRFFKHLMHSGIRGKSSALAAGLGTLAYKCNVAEMRELYVELAKSAYAAWDIQAVVEGESDDDSDEVKTDPTSAMRVSKGVILRELLERFRHLTSPLLDRSSLKDPRSFVERLRGAGEGVSGSLAEHIRDRDRQLLADFDSSQRSVEKLLATLNQILEEGQLYADPAFKKKLGKRGEPLIAPHQPQAACNRRALEDAFADQIEQQTLVLRKVQEGREVRIQYVERPGGRMIAEAKKFLSSVAPWGVSCRPDALQRLRKTLRGLIGKSTDAKGEAEADIHHTLIHPTCFEQAGEAFMMRRPEMLVPRFFLPGDGEEIEGRREGDMPDEFDSPLRMTEEQSARLKDYVADQLRRGDEAGPEPVVITVDGVEQDITVLDSSSPDEKQFSFEADGSSELVQVWLARKDSRVLLAACLLNGQSDSSQVDLKNGTIHFDVSFDGDYRVTVRRALKPVREEATKAAPHSRPRAARALVWASLSFLIVASVGLIVWRTMPTRPEGPPVYRSTNEVVLVAPEDGLQIKVYQEFKWLSLVSARSYQLTIKESRTGKVVLQVTPQQSSYILTDKDVAGMVDSQEYEWSVSADTGTGRLQSKVRKFIFMRPSASMKFTDFDESKRGEIEAQALDGDTKTLERLQQTLGNYINENRDKQSSDIAWALQTRGIAFTYLDKRDEAAQSFGQAAEMWERLGVPDPLLYARCLTNYASVTQDIGLIDKALHLYKRALVILRTREEENFLTKRSTCLLNLGTLYRELGLPRQAERSYSEALEIDRRLGDMDSVADELTNLGNIIVSEFDEPQRGSVLLEEAAGLQRAAMRRNGKPRPTMADTLDGLGVAYSNTGEQQKALNLFEEAIRIDESRGNETGILSTTNNMANLLMDDMGDSGAALRRYQEAVDIISRNEDANPDEVWRTYDGMGRAYLNLGDFTAAEKNFIEAIKTVEALRKTLEGRQLRRSFNAFRTTPYYGYTLLKLKQEDYKGAFGTIESGKATGLREPAQGVVTPGENAGGDSFDLDHLRQSLGEHQIAFEYLFGTKNDEGLLLAITKSAVTWHRLPKRKTLDAEISQVVEDLKRGDRSDEAQGRLLKLSDAIIPGEILGRIEQRGIRHIIVSPDGLLHNLPFEALRLNRSGASPEYLLKRFNVSIVPSFGWWDTIRQRFASRIFPASDLLVIANPVIGETGCHNPPPVAEEILASLSAQELPPLPNSQREANVAAKYASRNPILLTAQGAQMERFISSQPNQFKIVHFATHALSGGTLDTSLLIFGCAERMDVLMGSDIPNLKLDNQLVILSACDTDVGDTLFGEGNDSLASGFLMAGSGCVIATRWRVRDDVPAALMETFYDQLSKGLSVDEALREAKLQLMETADQNSGNWAAFTVLGYGDMKIPIKPASSIIVWRLLTGYMSLTLLVLLVVSVGAWLAVKKRRRLRSIKE